MEKLVNCVYEIKNHLLESPLRSRLSEYETIPLKNLVIDDLNDIIGQIECIENNESSPLKLVVMGEVKSGKSTLVNSLLNKDVSEMDVLEATSNIIEISYGNKYENKIIDGINKIKLDLEVLKKITIVDTPGIRTMTSKNENKTLSYIQNADLIVFVFDSTHLGQEDILSALELVETFKKPIIGVINKCDLLSEDKNEVMEFIQDEYGIYIEKFFLLSSYIEYKNIDSFNDFNDDYDKKNYYEILKKEFIYFKDYIDEIYLNSNDVKISSKNKSIKGLLQKEVLINYDYFKSITMLKEEVDKYEKILSRKLDYISSKMNFEIDDWVERVFFEDELKEINEDLDKVNEFINENYINKYISIKKEELDNLFFYEWEECIKEVEDEINRNINKHVGGIYYKDELLNSKNYKLDKDVFDMNDMLATVGTGAILGVTSGSIISVYAAATGSSAASMTIGSALMMYCPPLLIAGTVSGAIGKLIYDKVKSDKKSKDTVKEINEFIEKIKLSIKEELKMNYYKCSEEIISTSVEILKKEKGINMGKYEIENFIIQIEGYIEELKEYIK